ncbi:MAG TPA: aldose 1-epimerase family protein, partial [Anaerolineaceae bacterium]
GVRGARLVNAAGLDLTCLTERGMALTHLRYRGVPLGYISDVGAVHPAYSEHAGTGWLRTWPVGFLTPCGLTQIGTPCEDQGEQLGLHGRAASIPAREVSWGTEWDDDNARIWLQGTIRETAVFGDHLVLTRRIWTWIDSPGFWIEDRIENRGYAPSPLMFLQHINLGFPLVSAGSVLELGEHSTAPRTPEAEKGMQDTLTFSDPIAGYREQVFYHDLQPDAQGTVRARFTNPGFAGGRGLAVELRYRKDEYPVLVEWKMLGEGMYVVGVEPSNSRLGGRVEEREHGALPSLAPGESRHFGLEIRFSGLD